MTGIPKREFLEFFFENMKNNSDENQEFRLRLRVKSAGNSPNPTILPKEY
jgi:hypothetical protein